MKKIAIILFLLVSAGVCKAASINLHPKTATDTVLICDSKYAQFYHTHVCGGLKECKHQVVKLSKEEALKKGYKSCPICYPRVRVVPGSTGK